MKQNMTWEEGLAWMNANPKHPEGIRLKELEAKTRIDEQVIAQKTSEIASLHSINDQKDKEISELKKKLSQANSLVLRKHAVILRLEKEIEDKEAAISEYKKIIVDGDLLDQDMIEHIISKDLSDALTNDEISITGEDGLLH